MVFSACASAPRAAVYRADAPLSENSFRARDGAFGGRIPAGWIIGSEDTLAQALDVWLVREDFSASIHFREVNVDPPTRERIRREGLAFLADITLSFMRESARRRRAIADPPHDFRIGERAFCSFELDGEPARSRVVLFAAGERYYECEARPLKGIWRETDITALFTLQQSVLARLDVWGM